MAVPWELSQGPTFTGASLWGFLGFLSACSLGFKRVSRDRKWKLEVSLGLHTASLLCSLFSEHRIKGRVQRSLPPLINKRSGKKLGNHVLKLPRYTMCLKPNIIKAGLALCHYPVIKNSLIFTPL